MNNCYFVGSLAAKPDLSEDEGVSVVTFNLIVEDYRKDKSGKKKIHTEQFMFEAWDTAAQLISKCKLGDTMAVECVARWCDRTDLVYFRVKNFKVFK